MALNQEDEVTMEETSPPLPATIFNSLQKTLLVQRAARLPGTARTACFDPLLI